MLKGISVFLNAGLLNMEPCWRFATFSTLATAGRWSTRSEVAVSEFWAGANATVTTLPKSCSSKMMCPNKKRLQVCVCWSFHEKEVKSYTQCLWNGTKEAKSKNIGKLRWDIRTSFKCTAELNTSFWSWIVDFLLESLESSHACVIYFSIHVFCPISTSFFSVVQFKTNFVNFQTQFCSPSSVTRSNLLGSWPLVCPDEH